MERDIGGRPVLGTSCCIVVADSIIKGISLWLNYWFFIESCNFILYKTSALKN
jgi:hypothetical protein